MSNLNIPRFLNNVRSNQEVKKVFDSIDKKYSKAGLGANTPIPNHAFATAVDYANNPAVLYLSKKSYQRLAAIRKLMKFHDNYRENTSRVPRSIEFIATGYLDFDNNYIVTNIECPFLDETINRKNKETSFALPFDKNYNDVLQDLYFTHLNRRFDTKMAKCPIALLGYTKPPQYEENFETRNCFKMSEFAKATYPNESIDHPIITGVMSLTPYSIEKVASKDKLKAQYTYIDGSLEAAVITYDISTNTNCPKPNNIFNITQCKYVDSFEDTKSTSVEISQSKQPMNDIYCAKSFTHCM